MVPARPHGSPQMVALGIPLSMGMAEVMAEVASISSIAGL
jgi:hypothetical protein